MKINGYWLKTQSGTTLPVIDIGILDRHGRWHLFPFLLDTGAERSVLRYQVLADLDLELAPSDGSYLTGLGGHSQSELVSTTLRFFRDDGLPLSIPGPFHAMNDPIALDDNILGRDVLSNFALIIDRPGQVVALVAGQHRYQIVHATS